MLPVVLRFTHPVWAWVLPLALFGGAVLLARAAWLARASRSAMTVPVGGALIAFGAALGTAHRPIVPGPVVIHAFGLFLCAAMLLAWQIAKRGARGGQ